MRIRLARRSSSCAILKATLRRFRAQEVSSGMWKRKHAHSRTSTSTSSTHKRVRAFASVRHRLARAGILIRSSSTCSATRIVRSACSNARRKRHISTRGLVNVSKCHQCLFLIFSMLDK